MASYPPNPYPTVLSSSPAPPSGPPPPPSSSSGSKPHAPLPNPSSGPRVLRPQPASSYTPYQPHQPQQPPQFGQHPYAPPVKNTAENPAVAFAESAQLYNRKVQGWLDRATPYPTYRWAGTAVALVLFGLRVVYGQGWYIVAYGLAIFLLNIFLAFLQPRLDPSLSSDLTEQNIEEGGEAGSLDPSLSTDLNLGVKGLGGKMMGFLGVKAGEGGGGSAALGDGEEEFRPFIRRLPEFKFWMQATRATAISLLLTLTRAADIPVYWPILLVYFIVLFGLTMRRQLQHMIKYKYIPFDLGRKTKYGGGKNNK